jgi:hypothetical protein
MNHVARMIQYSTPRSTKCDQTFPVYMSPPHSRVLPASITTIWQSVIVPIIVGHSKVAGPHTSLDAVLLDGVIDEGVYGSDGFWDFGSNEVDGSDGLSIVEFMLEGDFEGGRVKPVEFDGLGTGWNFGVVLAGGQDEGDLCFLQKGCNAKRGLPGAACKDDCHDD